MNDPLPPHPETGERRLRTQEFRRATPMAVLIALGAAAGAGLALAEKGRLASLPPALLWIAVGLLAAGSALTLVLWLRRVDEVEIADQLWSSFVALQAFFIGAVCWEVLATAGAAPPVNRYTIYFATAGVSLAAYLWRRLRRN